MKKGKIVKAVREVLEELSTTSGVGGYLTPYAFSKDGRKNKATKQMEKLGFKKAKTKKSCQKSAKIWIFHPLK